MSRSFSPPLFKPGWWLLAAGLSALAAAVSLLFLIKGIHVNPTDPHDAMLRREVGPELWLLPGLFGLATVGLGWGAHRALAQQRLADVATLYSLEVGEVVPVDRREAA